MQPRFNRQLFLLAVDLAGISSFAGSTAFQDNRTFLSGIEWYGAAGNKTLTGVNFVA
jgi:hypothetical protein